MAPFTLLVAALIAPLAFAVPTPGNVYGTGGSAPAGWNAEVENFCTTPEVLQCCNGETIAGVAGEPDSTQTGCMFCCLESDIARWLSDNADHFQWFM